MLNCMISNYYFLFIMQVKYLNGKRVGFGVGIDGEYLMYLMFVVMFFYREVICIFYYFRVFFVRVFIVRFFVIIVNYIQFG